MEKKHERNLQVAKERMQMEMTKRRLDESIIWKHPNKPGDKITIINQK